MEWTQKSIELAPKHRGFHLITTEVAAAIPELGRVQVGILQLFIQHTSAAISISENADPDVRLDLEMAFSRIAPESWPYRHTAEGSDDMPAHVKAVLLGSSLTIPVSGGKLALGVWQGLYLCEHRNDGGRRTILATLLGTGISP